MDRELLQQLSRIERRVEGLYAPEPGKDIRQLQKSQKRFESIEIQPTTATSTRWQTVYSSPVGDTANQTSHNGFVNWQIASAAASSGNPTAGLELRAVLAASRKGAFAEIDTLEFDFDGDGLYRPYLAATDCLASGVRIELQARATGVGVVSWEQRVSIEIYSFPGF